jgi:hypothetical protein
MSVQADAKRITPSRPHQAHNSRGHAIPFSGLERSDKKRRRPLQAALDFN